VGLGCEGSYVNWPDFPSIFPIVDCAGPPSEYMKKLYLDTAMSWSRGAFNCAGDLVLPDHLVSGTDDFIREIHWMERPQAFSVVP
jgi:hypothetical protein